MIVYDRSLRYGGQSIPYLITTYADSESRILTLGHPHKHCRTSLLHELGLGKSICSASQTKSLSLLHNSRVYVTSYGTSVMKSQLPSEFFSSTRLRLFPYQILGPVGYGPLKYLYIFNSSLELLLFHIPTLHLL